MAATPSVLEREAQRQQEFYDKQVRVIKRKLPRLLKKANRQVRRGKEVFAMATIYPRYSYIVPFKGLSVGELVQREEVVVQRLLTLADTWLEEHGSPLRSYFLKSYSWSYGIIPNKIGLELPVEPVPKPRKKRR